MLLVRNARDTSAGARNGPLVDDWWRLVVPGLHRPTVLTVLAHEFAAG